MSMASRLALLTALLLLAIRGGGRGEAQAFADSPASGVPTAIVVQNFYYALPGKADEVYQWRLHASEVRARLGLAIGRVLKRTPPPAGAQADDLPDVVWECEYPNAQAREADIARLDASREFEPIEAHMQTLIRQFRRAIFSVARSG